MIRVLASDGMNKAAAADLRAKGYEVVEQFYEPEDLKKELANYDVLVVRSATKVREPIIDAAVEAGRLKLVIRGGVGVDNIDVKYAESKGLKVTNTPKASSDSVAELALGHMLAMARYISIANVTMREGKWEKKKYEGVELAGKTLGLIGMGRISQSIARKATALGMKVMYTDIFEIKGLPEEYVCATQEEVLKNADFVSLHIPAAKDGKPVITAEHLAMMKPTAFIVNTARGGLIDEDALVDALEQDKLAGAALYVFAKEPLQNERIMNCPKISLTPHIGGSTKEAQGRIGKEIVEIIENFFNK